MTALKAYLQFFGSIIALLQNKNRLSLKLFKKRRKKAKILFCKSQESCFLPSSDGSLEDPADFIDPRLLPQFLAFNIVSDTDNLLQILSCQA